MRVVCTEYEYEPYQDLFMWAVFFNRIPLANVFLWARCANPIGSALVASKLCKSMAKKANSPAVQSLAAELNANARFVVASVSSVRPSAAGVSEAGVCRGVRVWRVLCLLLGARRQT